MEPESVAGLVGRGRVERRAVDRDRERDTTPQTDLADQRDDRHRGGAGDEGAEKRVARTGDGVEPDPDAPGGPDGLAGPIARGRRRRREGGPRPRVHLVGGAVRGRDDEVRRRPDGEVDVVLVEGVVIVRVDDRPLLHREVVEVERPEVRDQRLDEDRPGIGRVVEGLDVDPVAGHLVGEPHGLRIQDPHGLVVGDPDRLHPGDDAPVGREGRDHRRAMLRAAAAGGPGEEERDAEEEQAGGSGHGARIPAGSGCVDAKWRGPGFRPSGVVASPP